MTDLDRVRVYAACGWEVTLTPAAATALIARLQSAERGCECAQRGKERRVLFGWIAITALNFGLVTFAVVWP